MEIDNTRRKRQAAAPPRRGAAAASAAEPLPYSQAEWRIFTDPGKELARLRELEAVEQERDARAGRGAPYPTGWVIAPAAPRGVAELFEDERRKAEHILALVESIDGPRLAAALAAEPITPLRLLWMLSLTRKRCERDAKSAQASNAASRKNIEAKRYVRAAWEARLDGGQSKAAFAREQVHHVKRMFGLKITEKQISDRWLARL